jgi:TetR/AcrR family transcriptional repressor of bet genes
MESVRREALVRATIAEVGEAGSLDVTVRQIAKRAGMSSGLAHHYFGGKDQIFLAAMRHILRTYGREVNTRLALATTPIERVEAIISASFDEVQFSRGVIRAWMSFYGMAQTDPEALRLLQVYQSRLRTHLIIALRLISGARAPLMADIIASIIDGRYLRLVATDTTADADDEMHHIFAALNLSLTH